MSKLQRLYAEQGQSPWLDNLTRGYLRDGTLARLVADGIRGVTANPTIFARAIEGSDDYDEQFASLIAAGRSVEDAYWELVVADVIGRLRRPAPGLRRGRRDATASCRSRSPPSWPATPHATIAAARGLHERIDEPNLLREDPRDRRGRARRSRR